jgi:glycosyltransferase involved in cell wall biosynthesis
MAEVTVVVPTFNCARFISNALNSVLTQSLQDFEIIIVDDGSFDDTGEIVKPYLDDRRIHYVLQENKGPSKARNHGIALANTKYLAFLDADDALAPEALSALHAALDKKQEACWCVTDVIWVAGQDVTEPHRKVMRAEIPEDLYYGILDQHNKLGRAIFFRRDTLVSSGMFDERFKGREDWELNIRLIHNKIPFVHVQEPLYLHHIRDGSLTRTTRGILNCTDAVMSKHHRQLAERGDHKAARIYAENLWDLGRQYFYNLHSMTHAASCVIRSLRYDCDLARVAHPAYHQLQMLLRVSRKDRRSH